MTEPEARLTTSTAEGGRAKWNEAVSGKKLREIATDSGIEVQGCYGPDDLEGNTFEDIGFPGQAPFTRGVYPAMYRDRVWQMRLYSGLGTAEDTNARWRFLLSKGNMGVSAAFDLPTQCGLDSDDSEALPEVGRVGVAVDTVRDFEIMLEGIPLRSTGISLNAHSNAPITLALFLIAAEREGVAPNEISGSMTTDSLKDYVARGTWLYPPGAAVRLVGDILEFCSREMPRFYPLVIRGPDMRDAGANMIQEVAFAFANGIAYLDHARERGLGIEEFARRLSAQFYFYGDFLQEAAKARAARRIWARLLQDRYGVRDEEALRLRITASVGGTHFQVLEPETNIVRGTLGCLGAVLGGCQGMLLAGYDEAYDIPTEETQRIALRTQQIVGYESDATATADPLGGSYFVEAMTDELERQIMGEIARIDDMGGAVAAIEAGYMQEQIAESAFKAELDRQEGRKTLVAVNKFASGDTGKEIVTHQPDPEAQRRQLARLAEVRADRDQEAVDRALEELKEVAAAGENVMAPLLNAARAQATGGEMNRALESVLGSYDEG